MAEKTYLAIDLKSFYASVECMERGMDPMTTNLVVADLTRTEKTICLAVSPSLKAYGIPGRTRLFDVVRRVKDINAERKNRALGYQFTGSSADDTELKENPSLELDYITAPPRMEPKLVPITVSTGRMAFFSACFQIILAGVHPFAFAVLM